MPEYTIDQNGIDGRWRVWWIGPTGHTCEALFFSRESAELWIEEAKAHDSPTAPATED